MRILFADRLPDRTIHDLEAHGHECVMEPGLGADDLAERIGGYDVLVVRGTQVGRPVIEAADRLALVIRAGAGTNTIDTDAAAERAVFVSNVPGRNAAAVAELTMGLLLAVDRRIADNVADVREGRWDKKTYGNAEGLLGSTMGILGLGSIGFLVAERAAAFGIRVQSIAKEGRSPAATARAEELGITMCGSLDELLGTSDIVSLHVPSNPETKHLVDAAFLARMKRGAILLNTSRGDVVDEAALLAALDEGRVRAGLDVFDDEPGIRSGRVGVAPRQAPRGRGHPPHRCVHRAGAAGHRPGRDRDRRRVHGRRGAPLRQPRARSPRRERDRRTPSRPRGGAGAGARRAQYGAPQRPAHGQPGLPRRRGRGRVHRRGGEASTELLDALRAIPHVLGVSVVVLDEDAGATP